MPRLRRTIGLRSIVISLTLVTVAACVPALAEDRAPDQTVTSIQASIESGNLKDAIEQVSAALGHYPNDGGLFNLRGVIRAQQTDLGGARKDFERAVALAPGLTPAWQNLARACQQGQTEADARCAAKAWTRVLLAIPNDAEARFSLAAIYEQQGKFADSLREIEKLPPQERDGVSALALRCADLAGLNRLKDAEDTARRVTTAAEFSEPEVKSILPALGTLERAPLVVILAEALDAHGAASPEILRALVAAYEQTNRLEDARRILERLTAADPQNPQHLFELARIAYKTHDLEGALAYLGHARDLAPSNARGHFLFGMVLQEMQLPVEARKSLEKAVAIEPQNPDYNYGLGSAILVTREAAPAVNCFRNYVAARPRDPRGHFALGVAYFATGDYAASRAEMQSISKNASTQAGAAYFLGRLARMEDNLDEAAALFEQSIRLLPSFPESHTELARVRLRQNRLEDAEAEIGRALALDADSFQANSALLALYQKRHDARAEQQSARLQKMDEERSKRQELMFRSIEVKPY